MRKLPQIGGNFRGENFSRLFAGAAKDVTPPNFVEKTCEQPQNLEIYESFLPRKFHTIRHSVDCVINMVELHVTCVFCFQLAMR